MNHFETDFPFDLEDSFSPSTGTSFSSESCYEPFTPTTTSRRSTPHDHIDFNDGPFYTAAPEHHSLGMTPLSPMFDSVKPEPDQLSFTTETVLPSTPMRKMERPFDIDQMLDSTHISGNVVPSHFAMGTISPEGTSMAPAPYMMTPTRSLSTGAEFADPSTWNMTQESPIAFFHPVASSAPLQRHSQSPLGNVHNPYSLQSNGASPSNRFRVQRKMALHEAQRQNCQLQRAHMRTTRTKPGRGEHGTMEIAGKAKAKCDYPGCSKAYQRNEHLKRHKQTYVLPSHNLHLRLWH